MLVKPVSYFTVMAFSGQAFLEADDAEAGIRQGDTFIYK
jgi:hypothetical protein